MITLQLFSKKVFITFTAVALFSINLFAQHNQKPQGPPSPPDSAQIVKMVEELTVELNLNETQKTKISELHFDHFAEAKAQMDMDKGQHEKHRELMDSLRKQFEEQVQELLSDEQKRKFEEFLKTRGPRPGKKKPKRQ